MGKTRTTRALALAMVVFMILAPSVFCASKSVTLVNGFDMKTRSFRWTGIGSNVSLAVTQAIDGLEGELENEIIDRCDRIADNYDGDGLNVFLKGISDNMGVMKREMIRRSRCAESFEAESGESVVSYCLDAADFESVFDKYVAKFNFDSDGMKALTSKIRSINRFLRGKYAPSQEIQVRVKP